MYKCVEKKAKQQWNIEKLQIQAARQKMKNHDTLPNKVEKKDATYSERQKGVGNFCGTSNAMRYANTHPSAKTPTRKVAVSKVGGKGPQH